MLMQLILKFASQILDKLCSKQKEQKYIIFPVIFLENYPCILFDNCC